MKLRETMNVNIMKAGIGDKVKLPPMLEVVNVKYSMTSTVFGLLVAAGVGVTAAAAIFTVLLARRHAKTRAKLAGLATPDPEASKDYQELCRARMQAKQLAEKPESPRIKCLSRESESNRSSTSSWNGEEAASLSNMEISTGHMVLVINSFVYFSINNLHCEEFHLLRNFIPQSYMEDHLNNKDKLDQEWAAICAYEADPSSIKVATDKSNVLRNRPGSALPYDHSRIILNDLSNIINSDYINASTIVSFSNSIIIQSFFSTSQNLGITPKSSYFIFISQFLLDENLFIQYNCLFLLVEYLKKNRINKYIKRNK